MITMKKLVPKPQEHIKEGLIYESIKKYIDQSNFPSKLVLSKLNNRSKEIKDSLEKAEKMNKTIDFQIEELSKDIQRLVHENVKKIEELKNTI